MRNRSTCVCGSQSSLLRVKVAAGISIFHHVSIFLSLWDGSVFRGIKIRTGFNISFFLGGNNTRPEDPDRHWRTSVSFVMVHHSDPPLHSSKNRFWPAGDPRQTPGGKSLGGKDFSPPSLPQVIVMLIHLWVLCVDGSRSTVMLALPFQRWNLLKRMHSDRGRGIALHIV